MYVKILNVRYNGRIEFIKHIDPRILDNKIVKLTLQPLIENAIYHGLKEKRGAWRLSLNGYADDEEVKIELEDNGIGISGNDINKITVPGDRKDVPRRQHIGIHATRERIRIYFGGEYGLQFISQEGKGTKVIIKLPNDGEVSE